MSGSRSGASSQLVHTYFFRSFQEWHVGWGWSMAILQQEEKEWFKIASWHNLMNLVMCSLPVSKSPHVWESCFLFNKCWQILRHMGARGEGPIFKKTMTMLFWFYTLALKRSRRVLQVPIFMYTNEHGHHANETHIFSSKSLRECNKANFNQSSTSRWLLFK